VMGRLVHTGLGSSSLVAHVRHNPPPPHANSFVLGPNKNHTIQKKLRTSIIIRKLFLARQKNTAPRNTAADKTHVQVACLRRKALVLCVLPSRAAQFSRRVFRRAGAAGS
jgi:hypothetical protein